MQDSDFLAHRVQFLHNRVMVQMAFPESYSEVKPDRTYIFDGADDNQFIACGVTMFEAYAAAADVANRKLTLEKERAKEWVEPNWKKQWAVSFAFAMSLAIAIDLVIASVVCAVSGQNFRQTVMTLFESFGMSFVFAFQVVMLFALVYEYLYAERGGRVDGE